MMAGIWQRISSHGVQLKMYSDPLFAEGNKHNPFDVSSGKKAVIVFDDEELLHESHKEFICHVPGCVTKFRTLLDFETHYNTVHRNSCDVCHKKFPTRHLLDLHVLELHDSFFLAQAERKPMYRCFIESCPVRSSNPAERRSHGIEAHGLPHDFRFDDSRKGPKKKKSQAEPMDVSEADSPAPQQRAKAVPKNLSFGRGASRGFSRAPKHWHQIHAAAERQTRPDVDLADMQQALPDLS